ncbi:MAG: ATP-binding cassette domain-containing protein [Acidimicrobiales bacterium]
MTGGPAIEVTDLAKRYEPAGVNALAGVSFEVGRGEIFGLLGRNGAGKSTTVRILTTLLRSTGGTAHVLGMDVTTEAAAVRRALGVALQEASLDELMTGREHLVLAARLVGLAPKEAGERAAELLEVFGLTGAADRIAARYSGGMRRRLDVAMALVRNPEVLFLDEPTTGLDPQSRRALWELIREQQQGGTTIFLTTQYLAEADELAERVAIVHGGRIAAIGAPTDLKERYGATIVGLRVAGADAEAAVRGVAGTGSVIKETDGRLVLGVTGGDAAVPALVGRLMTLGPAIVRLEVLSPTLEDVFVTLTGTELEVGAGSDEAGSLSAVRRNIGLTAGSGR